jgi:putative transposase
VPKTRFPKDDVPDDLWARIEPLIPIEKERPKGGRPPLPARAVFAQVVFRLRTGCPWKALPNGSTVHRRFSQWSEDGVFERLWMGLVYEYDAKRGAGLDWTSLDSATVKAPKGGTRPGPIRPIAPRVAPSAMF